MPVAGAAAMATASEETGHRAAVHSVARTRGDRIATDCARRDAGEPQGRSGFPGLGEGRPSATGPAGRNALVVHGRPEPDWQRDRTDRVFRPRAATAKVSAAACAIFLGVSLATGSRGPIWLAAVPFLFLAQCFQHLEVVGNRARRYGLRAVELDLTTAEIAATGRSWWVELFFLGHCLELRDADGRGLLLESWLWSSSTRDALLRAVRAANGATNDHPIGDENGGEARS